MAIAGLILFALGAYITVLNIYLTFLRYPLHRARGGTRENFVFVSVVPIFGSLLLWISIPLLTSMTLKWCAGVLSVLDVGGIHRFIFILWQTGQLGMFSRNRIDRK